MKRLLFVLTLMLVLSAPAFALSDAEYLRMKKSSKFFADADMFSSDAYGNVKDVMPRSEFEKNNRDTDPNIFLRYIKISGAKMLSKS